MSVLIALRSCVRDALRGDNQAVRDTWAKGIPFDYKFFIGDGTPAQDELPITSQYGSVYAGRRQEDITEITPQSDEQIVPCPDDYFSMPYKVKEICKYAAERKYNHVFSPCDDVYVDVERLKNSGFEDHDYVGNFWNNNPYAHGGPGFWLSGKAIEVLAEAPVTSRHDDEWVGLTLTKNGVKGHHDPRYAYDSDVLTNDTIALHLTFIPGSYGPLWLRTTAERWPVDLEWLPTRQKPEPITIHPHCIRLGEKPPMEVKMRRDILTRRPDGRYQRRYE